MNINKAKAVRALTAVILPLAMMAPVMSQAFAADATTPIQLYAPKDLKGVPALPFTGVKSPTFSTASTTAVANLDVFPQQGPEGTPITITGKALAANATLQLTWSTADGYWKVGVDPTTVNYMGNGYTKYNINLASVTTDANGGFTFKTKIPRDFGGLHDIYALASDNSAVAHGGFQMNPTISISPTSGAVGTVITVQYTGLGPNLYTGGASVLWDNSFVGGAQGVWTRGYAKFTIRAAGDIGTHYVAMNAGIGVQYMNTKQSPVPWSLGGKVAFKITKDAGAPKATIEYPDTYQTLSADQHTTLSTEGVDTSSTAKATLSAEQAFVGQKVKLNVTGLSTTGDHEIVWASVVGNRVNCTGTCWIYTAVPMGPNGTKLLAAPSAGNISQDITIPDHLGGWHVIQVKSGNKIEAQVPVYVKESIFNYLDKSGNVLSAGVAAADTALTPELRDGSGVPKNTFKAGEEFTIAMKGVGWTQLDNTLTVTYDNSYIGYGCGFNSNGYMVVHLVATGKPGTHLIELRPVLYTNQPSFPNTPYGMLPMLTNMTDLPGLALGYQPPTVRFAITITK
jgi:hypothetical protein